MAEPWVVWVFGALTAVGAFACAWFVVALHALTGGAWRDSAMGRHSMALGTALLVLLAVTNPALRGIPGRVALLLVGTLGLVIALVWRVILLHRAQKSERSGRAEVSDK